MKKSRLLGAFYACVFSSGIFNAAGAAELVEKDLNTQGDGLITLDTATNLEWLDLTATQGQSYNSVAAGIYVNTHGFHFATRTDTGTLYMNAGFSGVSGTSMAQGDIDAYNLLISLMGCTTTSCSDPNNPISGIGMIDLEPFSSGFAGSSEYSKNLDGSGNIVWADQSSGVFQKTSTNSQRGAFLVREASTGDPEPDITVTNSTGSINPLLIPFGNITEMTSVSHSVLIQNDGDADLVIGQIAVNDPLAAPFSIFQDSCTALTLTPNTSCNFFVEFSPPSTGAFNDTLDIPSNDPDEDPVTFSLTGTGISASAPEITVTDSVNPDNDLQVPFGEVTEMTSVDQTVTITNDGTANLDIGQIAAANTVAAPFSIPADTCSNQSLAPAANCSLTVRFAPPSPGVSSDSFDIPSSDGDEDPVIVSVSGTGTVTPPPDSNGDGISDADAIALGLDPNDQDGDTDDDGLSDVDEVGDVDNPMDNDGDGVIDALEPGPDAGNAETASGLTLASGDTVTITTAAGEMLSEVSAAEATDSPSGFNFPFGTVSYTTTAPMGGSVTVRMTFSVDLPDNLVIDKVDENNNHTELPTSVWTQVDVRSVDITLTDGNPQTDLDEVENGLIVDPVAVGNTTGGGGGGGGGGGCTVGSTDKVDPVWLFILFVSGVGLLQWRRMGWVKVALKKTT